jgi:glycosyltransferase involved in cell wall biosynthesis
MRIAFVSQWFPPEPGTVVASSIADGLANRGHHVEVLTGFPNYPTGRLRDDYPIQYYRQETRSERVTVHRFPLYPSHNHQAFPRALNYLSFASSTAWLSRRRIPQPDAWLIYSSPATTAIPALLAPARNRAPICLLIMDLWPDSVTDSGFLDAGIGRHLGRAAAVGLTRLCQWSYRRASFVGITSPGMRAILLDRGVPPRKIRDTPNHIDDFGLQGASSCSTRAGLGLPGGRLFLYAGNVGSLQGLENLISAFSRLPEAQLAIVGDGVERAQLQTLASRLKARNITFIGNQSTQTIGAFLEAADVHVVSLKDTPLMRITMPSKAQVAMALGKPILAHLCGDTANLVADRRIGAVANPTDMRETVAAIECLTRLSRDELDTIGRRSRELYEAEYSNTVGIDRLERMLNDSLGRPRMHEPSR